MQGPLLYPFLDDLLMGAVIKEAVHSAKIWMLKLFQAHNFTINAKKNALIPSTRIAHLRAAINTAVAKVYPLLDRFIHNL